MPGKLYLIPAPLGPDALHTLPAQSVQVMHRLDYFVVEHPKTARHFLKAAGYPRPLPTVEMVSLNEHTPSADIQDFLKPVLAGRDAGLMSEAGCPGVADPGAPLVALAHKLGIEVVPLTGPSSVLLALMASGMNGQQFAFAGYLPAKKEEVPRVLRQLEQDALRRHQTQIFIEAPYRNDALLQSLLKTLGPDTRLCVAADISLPTEWIRTFSVKQWQKSPLPNLHKRPVVFLIGR